MVQKFILHFTSTGMIPTKDMTLHVPIAPSEIIEDVLKAVELGVTKVHLHSRSPGAGLLISWNQQDQNTDPPPEADVLDQNWVKHL